MQLFAPIYTKVLQWAAHRHATKYVAALSVAESSFFPIPVDVMLAPMVLAKPQRWWRLALLVSIMSVLGGIIGYFIGDYFLDWVTPVLQKYGYWERFLVIKQWFQDWGIWVIFVAGFSPIPYKIFTIAAGSFGMAAGGTIIAAIISKANSKGALFTVLAFPILLPVLISAISATRISLNEAQFSAASGELQTIFAYTVVIITVSILLFDFIWNE